MSEQTKSKIEKILRKHVQSQVKEMGPGFKEKMFPDMSDEEILEKRVKHLLDKATLQGEGNVMITQNRGYYVIDCKGKYVDGCYADAS